MLNYRCMCVCVNVHVHVCAHKYLNMTLNNARIFMTLAF